MTLPRTDQVRLAVQGWWAVAAILALPWMACSHPTPTACQISNTLYPAGTVNPANPCQSCQPTVDALRWSLRASTDCDAGPAFDAGLANDAGTSGCLIGGSGFANGQLNPGNSCERCEAAINATGWENLAQGSACGQGGVCSNGVCFEGCLIDGGVVVPGGHDTGGCGECLPQASLTSWTAVPDGTACGDPGVPSICSSGACRPGCFISGAYHAPGALNATSSCLSCQPAASVSQWTPTLPGTPCGLGLVCDQAGQCQPFDGCTIAWGSYPSGSSNPNDPSQCCNPKTNAGGWVARLQDGGSYPTESGIGITGIAFADFDGDGLIDIVTAPGPEVNGSNLDWGIGIRLGRADGTFGPSSSYLEHCVGSWGISAGDLNGDGYPDIVTGVCGDGTFNVFINKADGTGAMFPAVGVQFATELSGAAFPLRDFDNNGTLDLVLASHSAYYLEGLGTGGFADPAAYSFSGDPSNHTWIAAGQFRMGGGLDFVVGDSTTDELNVYLGDGRGSFAAQSPFTGVGATYTLAVGDFDGDGLADIATGGSSSLALSIFLGLGDGTFSQPTTYSSAGAGAVALVDLDRDGKAEAVVANFELYSLSVVWHFDGGTTLSSIPRDAA